MFLTPLLVILLTLCNSYAKIYERCELARELRNFDLPEDEIPTWVCIAQHESNYDTAAMNHGSGDHGLFQISQIYWCSPPGQGYGCNSPCSKFRDDDISDDLQCIRRIHNEHTRISGDGFNAWVVYPLYCKNDNSKYIEGCFDNEPDFVPNNATENEIPDEEVDEYGDGYQFPPLPNFPKTSYEFPKLPFSRVSIHDSIPLNQLKYNFPTFPFSRKSIHDFKSVTSTTEKVTEDYFKFPPFPVYSKQSIHHFIPVSTTSQKPQIDVTEDEDESEYSFPPLPTGSDKTFKEFKPANDNEISYSLEDTTEYIGSKSTVSNKITTPFSFSTTSYKPFFTSDFVTSKPSTTSTQRSLELQKFKTSSIQLPTTTSRTKYPIFTTMKNLNSEYTQTLRKQFQSSQKSTETNVFTTTLRSVSTKPNKSKSFLPPFSYGKAFNSTQTLTSTTSKQYFTTLKWSSTSKQFALPYKSFTSKHSQTTKKTEKGDLQGASSTLVPFKDFFELSTTTYKPFFTTTVKSPTSEKYSSGAFSQRDAFSTTTKNSFASESYTTSKPFTNYSFSKMTTPAAPKRPMSKQVTFAPDSFFSWIFGSQTLPPLVGPSRPVRPPGERPGGLAQSSPMRPSIFERPRPEPPGHLPRPPPRPNRIRPGENNVSAFSQDVPAMRPHHNRPARPPLRPFSTAPATQPKPSIPPEVPSAVNRIETISSSSVSDSPLQQSTIGPNPPPRPNRIRPGEDNASAFSQDVPAMRPHHNRPPRPPLRPFSTAPATQPRPSFPPEVPSAVNRIETTSSSSVSDSPLQQSTIGPRNPISSGRSGYQRNLDTTAFEVKLDDKFVFLRTKFGYRLFRSDKK